jgi:hypothetical protein
MSNFFQQISQDADNVEQSLLGPDYEYWKQINAPSQIGMSRDGNLGALAHDVEGLIAYVELLVTGGGKGSKTGNPLGNKFFLKTGATCKDNKTAKDVTRYVYINNVPTGNIPFISSAMGMDFSDFEGLIPGAMSNLNELNPFAIFSSFMTGTNPPCQELTMDTTPSSVNNNQTSETHHVIVADIKNMDSCIFPNKTNPITKQNCMEAFSIINESKASTTMVKVYFAILGLLGLYLVTKVLRKTRK